MVQKQLQKEMRCRVIWGMRKREKPRRPAERRLEFSLKFRGREEFGGGRSSGGGAERK